MLRFSENKEISKREFLEQQLKFAQEDYERSYNDMVTYLRSSPYCSGIV